VILDADQEDGNDLDKCIKHINQHWGIDICIKSTVIILGACGGRFDQEAASFHALYRWDERFFSIILFGESNSIFLLQPEILHRIRLFGYEGVENGPSCGLIPLAGPVRRVSTSGLVWNLFDEGLALGVRISTSNRLLDGVQDVTIVTSEPLLWTCERHVTKRNVDGI
jgi:thiamine pyrophosphokinase